MNARDMKGFADIEMIPVPPHPRDSRDLSYKPLPALECPMSSNRNLDFNMGTLHLKGWK